MEITDENCIKNILLVGNTGSGKSSIANTLTNTNDFEVGGDSPNSVTKWVQTGEFKFDGVNYRIIDTIGIGDTELSQEQVLYKILEGINQYIEEGLYQIFFVTNSTVKFTESEKKTYELFEGETFFGKKMGDFTTIIRTKFSGFRDSEKCKKHMQELDNNKQASEIIKKCNDVVFINNFQPKGEKQTGKTLLDCLRTIFIENFQSQERKHSRKILLEYLKNCKNNIYKPKASFTDFLRVVNEFDLLVEETSQTIDEYFKSLNILEEKIPNLMNNREETINCVIANKESLNKKIKTLVKNNDNSIIISGLSTLILTFSEVSIFATILNTAILNSVILPSISTLAVMAAPMIPLYIASFFYLFNGISVNSKEREDRKKFKDTIDKDFKKFKEFINSLEELNKIHEKFVDINERFDNLTYKKGSIDQNKIGILKDILSQNFKKTSIKDYEKNNEKDYNYSDLNFKKYIKSNVLGILGMLIPIVPLSGIMSLVKLYNKNFKSHQISEEVIKKKSFCNQTFIDMEELVKKLDESFEYIEEINSYIETKIDKCNDNKKKLESILKYKNFDFNIEPFIEAMITINDEYEI
ncbi:AIG1 family-domain-containing protein [Gigaspora rosea]|uniref:AIG1 family-domain-containing protein n=1 Tax=Gigaspora rosea TaxID=44941 RepID=A0A397VBK5_9GLOM|nr:AIG1 family-domain-containing protein [Gigaspora rosea]